MPSRDKPSIPFLNSVNNISVICFSFRQSIWVSSFLTYLNDKRKSAFPPNPFRKSLGIKNRKYEYLQDLFERLEMYFDIITPKPELKWNYTNRWVQCGGII